tara:strand:- start:3290 stop:4021 length:732 start_codon:yes stop_codon:yes gene_type:complete
MELENKEKIILALDGVNKDHILNLLEKLPDLVWVKVGLELFTLYGPNIIQDLRGRGKKVFLDLKFHDIPNTMASACYAAAKTGSEIITLHTCAGKNALKISKLASLKAAEAINCDPPKIIGVSVLTSWSQVDFSKELAIKDKIEDRVLKLSKLAIDSNLDGCVCSILELEKLKSISSNKFELITPGIRLQNNSSNDQARVSTPKNAILKGANRLVVGRPIIQSEDPLYVFNLIVEQINSASNS